MVVLVLLTSSLSFGCSCSEEPVPAENAVRDLLKKHFDIEESKIINIQRVRHHSTLLEILDYKISGQSSCSGLDQNGDVWVMCMPKYVNSLLVELRECSFKVKVITRAKKAKAKVLESTCDFISKKDKFKIKY